MTTPPMTLSEELGHFLRSSLAASRRNDDAARAAAVAAVRDPWSLLDAAAVLMEELVSVGGFSYDDVVEKLVKSTRRDQVSAAVREIMVACVRSGEHTWNPITDRVGVTTDDHADWIREAHEAIEQCLCDPTLTADPITWAALEMHYRRTFPTVWPPADDQGVEFHVTSSFAETAPGQWRHRNIVLETVDETDGGLTNTVHVFEPDDARLLVRLISYELNNPRPIPADLVELVELVERTERAADPTSGLRVVRDDA